MFFAPRNAVLFLLVMAPVFIWPQVAILSEKNHEIAVASNKIICYAEPRRKPRGIKCTYLH